MVYGFQLLLQFLGPWNLLVIICHFNVEKTNGLHTSSHSLVYKCMKCAWNIFLIKHQRLLSSIFMLLMCDWLKAYLWMWLMNCCNLNALKTCVVYKAVTNDEWVTSSFIACKSFLFEDNIMHYTSSFFYTGIDILYW
jgi:hypothetical protein